MLGGDLGALILERPYANRSVKTRHVISGTKPRQKQRLRLRSCDPDLDFVPGTEQDRRQRQDCLVQVERSDADKKTNSKK